MQIQTWAYTPDFEYEEAGGVTKVPVQLQGCCAGIHFLQILLLYYKNYGQIVI